MRKCIFDGCEREPRSGKADYCGGHYRQYITGTELAPLKRRRRAGMNRIEVLRHHGWTEVQRIDGMTPCWEWDGVIMGTGYGQVRFGGRNRLAHRMMLEESLGEELPREIDACHRCDNPCCLNPEHLFPGTRKENLADMVAKGRQRKPKLAGVNK